MARAARGKTDACDTALDFSPQPSGTATMSTIIQWRCFAPVDEEDKRLRYARYVMIAAVFVCAIGLVMCITLSIAGLALVLLALLVMLAVAGLNILGTSDGGQDATLQADLPAYHEAGFQQHPVVPLPAPDVPPPHPVADNEPPPPSYQDAVSSKI
ncbi:Hypp5115 [Branchiostoma lanceolatum]|uniref:Hypp5115 protein n=1 Tax=Branchiostoma lanceolatum TaxID=7740 RepID=A0A8K0ACG6_BRALA|nr:Hypp5115 [Branchiostoma lanceolatum]